MKRFLSVICLIIVCLSLSSCNGNTGAIEDSQISSKDSSAHTSGKQDSETYMPNQEPGMRFVYDGAHSLIKIANEDNSLYFFPSDSSTPGKYQGSTWFIIDPAVNPSQNEVAFDIDTSDGIGKAQTWITQHVAPDKREKIMNSVKNQCGTKCLIYYEILAS